MKIHILGSCSGTEPYPGRRHTSFVLEHRGLLHWFDAGEGCAHTAHLMGLDLLKCVDIYISHSHMDHTGGLGNLLWCIRKLTGVKKHPETVRILVFTSSRPSFDGFMAVLGETEGGFRGGIEAVPVNIADGLLSERPEFRVEARHNFHLPAREDGTWPSYSFRITADGRRVVYSGDVRDLDDLGDWLDDCDLLLMETGHHKASEVCRRLRSERCGVGELLFLHHGRELLDDYDNAVRRAEEAWGGSILFASDGMTVERF